MNLHSKICLHTHPYVVVHLKYEKDKYLGLDGGEEACSAGRAADGAVLFDLTATTSIL